MKSKIISFVLFESPKLKKGEVLEVRPSQSAPQYFEAAVPRQVIIDERKAKVNERDVVFLIKSYKPDVLLVETTVEVKDIFSNEAFELREALINQCREIATKKYGGKPELSEEYSIATVSEYQGNVEQFLKQAPQIAGFLKSERTPLAEKEIEYTLSSQIKYAQNDLVIVDWDGAFVFYSEGDFEPIIELMELANLQLLRYRILENDLGERLKKVSKLIQQKEAPKMFVFSTRELAQSFKEVIRVRAQSIASFESLERGIKLIGDWYSARLYDLLSKKFRLEDWRRSIMEKLESLEDVYNIVSENFSVSRLHLLELAQIILFFVLQAGWFTLIILEFLYFTR